MHSRLLSYLSLLILLLLFVSLSSARPFCTPAHVYFSKYRKELRLKGISRSQRSIVASVPITREAARDGMETFLGEIYSAISICSMSYDSDAGRGNAVDPSTTNLYTLAGSAEHFVTISMAMVDAEIARRAARPGTTIETVGDMVYGQTHRVMSLLEIYVNYIIMRVIPTASLSEFEEVLDPYVRDRLARPEDQAYLESVLAGNPPGNFWDIRRSRPQR